MVENPDPGFTTNEVAEEFGKTRQWAAHRLGIMEEDGLIDSKKGGHRTKWYWPSSAGKELLRDERR
jgi:predicted transcriptional regulator